MARFAFVAVLACLLAAAAARDLKQSIIPRPENPAVPVVPIPANVTILPPYFFPGLPSGLSGRGGAQGSNQRGGIPIPNFALPTLFGK
ncbi:hypothetical protein Rsub_12277 [Raphidocelis subcapitata]|uniref:Uncharacterized protein n=1 Tax=Raphidocelis subcapitata TaxID=307507 RepID=A0A2V0PIV9_9CHLO|nr:hypothetical protein Rsub_12277 [Raphidocelis subcapitata]|eukprot:GBF99499.1 hypothetical protein Rsub_12277 [Raphidocelis subcapitata]